MNYTLVCIITLVFPFQKTSLVPLCFQCAPSSFVFLEFSLLRLLSIIIIIIIVSVFMSCESNIICGVGDTKSKRERTMVPMTISWLDWNGKSF